MKRKIEVTKFTPRQISQKRSERALAACLPDLIREDWLYEFRYQNELLRAAKDEPLSAAEFILVKLDTFLGCGRPF